MVAIEHVVVAGEVAGHAGIQEDGAVFAVIAVQVVVEVILVVAVVGDGVADGGTGAVNVADDVVVVALPPAQVDALGAGLALDLPLEVGPGLGDHGGGVRLRGHSGGQVLHGGKGLQQGHGLGRGGGGNGFGRGGGGGVGGQQVQRHAEDQRQQRGEDAVFHIWSSPLLSVWEYTMEILYAYRRASVKLLRGKNIKRGRFYTRFDKKTPAVYTASQGRCNKRQAVSHSPERG